MSSLQISIGDVFGGYFKRFDLAMLNQVII